MFIQYVTELTQTEQRWINMNGSSSKKIFFYSFYLIRLYNVTFLEDIFICALLILCCFHPCSRFVLSRLVLRRTVDIQTLKCTLLRAIFIFFGKFLNNLDSFLQLLDFLSNFLNFIHFQVKFLVIFYFKSRFKLFIRIYLTFG